MITEAEVVCGFRRLGRLEDGSESKRGERGNFGPVPPTKSYVMNELRILSFWGCYFWITFSSLSLGRDFSQSCGRDGKLASYDGSDFRFEKNLNIEDS